MLRHTASIDVPATHRSRTAPWKSPVFTRVLGDRVSGRAYILDIFERRIRYKSGIPKNSSQIELVPSSLALCEVYVAPTRTGTACPSTCWGPSALAESPGTRRQSRRFWTPQGQTFREKVVRTARPPTQRKINHLAESDPETTLKQMQPQAQTAMTLRDPQNCEGGSPGRTSNIY